MPSGQDFNRVDQLSLDNIKAHREVINTAVKTLNNIIFVIAAGTFGVSISFIGYLKAIPHQPWLLIFSWVCLFCAIVGNMSVHFLNAVIAGINIKDLNAYRVNNFMPAWDMTTPREPSIKPLTRWAYGLTFFVFGCLALGIVFLIFFAGINLLSQNNTPNQPVISDKV